MTFPLQPQQKYYITQYEELGFHCLLRWKIIILPILTSSLLHSLYEGWEKFEIDHSREWKDTTPTYVRLSRQFLHDHVARVAPRDGHVLLGADAPLQHLPLCFLFDLRPDLSLLLGDGGRLLLLLLLLLLLDDCLQESRRCRLHWHRRCRHDRRRGCSHGRHDGGRGHACKRVRKKASFRRTVWQPRTLPPHHSLNTGPAKAPFRHTVWHAAKPPPPPKTGREKAPFRRCTTLNSTPSPSTNGSGKGTI